ncbi:MAG: glycosyltransferase [Daejeonella sp.]
MKIIHLNTYAGNGGAGKACLRLNAALNKQGLDSHVAVNFLFENNPEVCDLSKGFFLKWFTAGGIILERLRSRIYTKPLPIPFSIPLWGRDISNNPLLLSADVIHLHWINHAFLRPGDIAGLARLNKPVVWTFHDSNAFTGGCHVRYSCDHYQNECGNCPVLKDPGPEDVSHRIWIQKYHAYQGLKLNIIAPSQWMAESVRKSKLLATRNIVNIPNTLDTAVFKPLPKSEARAKLGIATDKFIMMSGFMPSRKDLHKGTSYLVEAIDILIRDPRLDRENMELVIFGNRDDKNVPGFPVLTTFLGTISSEEKLAYCYSAADVFLAPSLEDNLPYTVMESLSCGTPVVAFTTGGIPDMVQHKHNGYLAEYRSSEDLAAGIKWVFDHPERDLLGRNSRKYVEDNFSGDVIAKRHMELYSSLVNDDSAHA